MSNEFTYNQTGNNEWAVYLDGKAIGYVSNIRTEWCAEGVDGVFATRHEAAVALTR